MIRSLKRALQPAITDVSLKFQVQPECEVVQSPQNLPPIFSGEKLVVYAVIQSKTPLKESKSFAILSGNMMGEKQDHKVPFTLDSSAAAPSLPVVHHLAAKALIADWESEYKEKKSIVDLSIESSVISSHTAFITIDEESSEPVSGAMKTYDIRAQLCSSESGRLSFGSDASSDESDDCLGFTFGMEDEEELRHLEAEKGELCEGELEYELASWSEGEGQERVLKQRMEKADEQAAADRIAGLTTLTNLVTAQQVNGSWVLNASLAQLMGKSLQDLESACPIEMKEEVAGVWATVLAVSLLRARYSSQQDEWELIAMKAESWLKKQSLPPGCTLEQLFQAAQRFCKMILVI